MLDISQEFIPNTIFDTLFVKRFLFPHGGQLLKMKCPVIKECPLAMGGGITTPGITKYQYQYQITQHLVH